MNTKSIDVLLVEDSAEDVDLLKEAFGDSPWDVGLSVVDDGEKAIDYLKKKAPYQEASRPDLIILDLNLPKKSGHYVLSEIKMDFDLKTIPVVILTTSRFKEDIIKSYRNYANCYIYKPENFEKYFDVVNEIQNFWFDIVALPMKKGEDIHG